MFSCIAQLKTVQNRILPRSQQNNLIRQPLKLIQCRLINSKPPAVHSTAHKRLGDTNALEILDHTLWPEG